MFQPTKLPESCRRSSHVQANGNAPEGVGGKEQHNSFIPTTVKWSFPPNFWVAAFLFFFIFTYNGLCLTLAHDLFCSSLTAHLVHLKEKLSLYFQVQDIASCFGIPVQMSWGTAKNRANPPACPQRGPGSSLMIATLKCFSSWLQPQSQNLLMWLETACCHSTR